MNPRTAGAVALAGLLVLAGCSALPGGGRTTTTDTVTPVPVTTSETGAETATPPPPPPGVSLDGVENVTRLVEAHERYLADRSYRWEFRYGVRAEQAAAYNRNLTRRAVVGDGRFVVRQTSPGLAANETLYVDGGEAFYRSIRGNETEYEVVVEPRDHRSYAFAGDTIRRFLRGASFDVDVVTVDGQSYYRLHTVGDVAPVALRNLGGNVWNYTATAYVTPEGFVRTLVAEYDQSNGPTTEHVAIRYDYSAVGATSLDRPDWVSQVTPIGTTATATTPPPSNATVTTPPPPAATATTTNQTATGATPTATTDPGTAADTTETG